MPTIKRRRRAPNPLKIDPTRTAGLRRRIQEELKRRFARLRLIIHDLLIREDAFGLLQKPGTMDSIVAEPRQARLVVDNAFCPTGPGGGIDPTCSPGGSKGGGGDEFAPTGDLAPAQGTLRIDKRVNDTDVDIFLKEAFGGSAMRNYDRVVEMLGVNDADIDVYEHLTANLEDDAEGISVKINHDAVTEGRRFIGRDKDGTLFIRNEMLYLRNTSKGLGTEIFSKQVASAKAAGVQELRTVAGGNYNTSQADPPTVGYQVWPKMGYDGSINDIKSDEVKTATRLRFPEAKTIQDIYKTKEGRDWWARNGGTFEAKFDLRPGSKSLKILSAYLAQRKARAAAAKGTTSNLAVRNRKTWTLSGINWRPTASYNAFCPTGEGGGVDPTCSPGKTDPGRQSPPRDIEEALGRFNDLSKDLTGRDGGRAGTFELDVGDGRRISLWLKPAVKFEGESIKEEYRVRIDFSVAGRDDMSVSKNVEAASIRMTRAVRKMAEAYHRAGFQLEVDAADERRREAYGRILSKAGLKKEGVEGGSRKVEIWNLLTINTRWQFQSDPERVNAFKAWLRAMVHRNILNPPPPDQKTRRPGEPPPARTGTRPDEDQLFRAYIEEGFRKGAGRAFDDTQKARRFAPGEGDFYRGGKEQFLRDSFARPVAAEKVRLLAGRAFDDLEDISTTMSNRMVRHLTDGLVQGKSPREIARDMDDDIDGLGLPRALTVARTEIVRAHAEGQLLALEDLGVEEVGVAVEWSTTGDDRVCELCEPMEGVVLKLEEAHGMIPRHPNAIFAGSTFASYGECKELVRAWYRGPAVVLTLGRRGYRTTIGPNHPVMTRRGMVLATQLREGDQILYDRRGDCSTHRVDHKQVPSVEDVFQSSVGILGDAAVVASTSDLHGDRVFCQGKVEAIRPTGSLLVVRDSCGVEKLRQDYFTRTDTNLPFRAGSSTRNLRSHGILLTSAGSMGSGNLTSSLVTRHLTPFDEFGFGLSTKFNSQLSKSGVDRSGGNTERPGDGHGRFTSKITASNFFVWKRVHEVTFAAFEGWAFDATTATSLYCSDGFVVSNCRCAFIPANVGEDDEGQKATKGSIDRAIRASLGRDEDDEEEDYGGGWGGASATISRDRPRSILGNTDPALLRLSELLSNAFCPTGPGGGIDPTCSPGGTAYPGGGSGGGEAPVWKYADELPDHDSWKGLTPEPGYVYHATNKENAAEVQESALTPHRPSYGTDQETWPDGSTARRSYFTDSPAVAWQFAPDEGKPALLRVRRSANFKTESTGDLYLEGKRVKPEAMEILTKEGWRPLKARADKTVQNAFCATGPGGGVDPTCSPGSGGGGAGTSIMGRLKEAGAKAAHLKKAAEQYVRDKVGQALSKLPAPMRTGVEAAYYVGKASSDTVFAAWTASQALVERVAKERGFTGEQARRLRGILATTDKVLVKAVRAGLSAVGGGIADLGVVSMIPPATAGYLAYSTARNPMATYRAAKKAIQEKLSRGNKSTGAKPRSTFKPGVEQLETRNTEETPEERTANLLADAIADIPDDQLDWFNALYAAALEETNNVRLAVQVAREVMEEQTEPDTEPLDNLHWRFTE